MGVRNNILKILQCAFINKKSISSKELEDVADKIHREIHEIKLIPFLNVKKNELELVDVREVLFVQLPKPKSKYLVYTEDGRALEQITKGFGIEPLFFDPNFFVIVDSKSIVNRDKVKKFDSEKCRLYFTEQIDENSLYIQVFQKIIAEFSIILGKHNDIRSVSNLYIVPKGFTKKLFNT